MQHGTKAWRDQQISWEHPRHQHGLATIASYSVVLTDWSSGSGDLLERVEVATTDHYGRALELVRGVRDGAGDQQYGVIDTVYTCGCRSDRITGRVAQTLGLDEAAV